MKFDNISQTIWFDHNVHEKIDLLNEANKNTLIDFLEITISRINPKSIEAAMPILDKHTQPMGIMHGGASAVLAETLGSIGSILCLDRKKYYSVGQNLNINHLRKADHGKIINGIAKPIKIGKKVHLWKIDIFNEDNEVIAVSNLTTIVCKI
jgi:1,4-dihydroxy-2-naphthoyl-CoA hydrolase